MTTKVMRELERAAEAQAGDPERALLIERTRRFKSSWVELAEALSALSRSERYRAWGYESLEAYAKGELHLRPETVLKLTGSFAFLQRRAPEVLSRDGVGRKIPSYQAVDFLRRAEEGSSAPRDLVDALRAEVIDEGRAYPTLQRRFGDAVLGGPPRAESSEAAGLRNVARRLLELVEQASIVAPGHKSELVAALSRLLGSLDDEPPS
ncbi:MAG: hypothetical protein IT374_18835 [Polyangiaceae bacterium]|nr:hypothetical protein [Polyangiaceae bacterium]